MIRLASVVGISIAVLVGCESAKTTTPVEPRSGGLRVPLPEGWRATALSAGLQVGPQGKGVLELESTTRPLPSEEAFLGALSAEGVEILTKESDGSFVGARYSIGVEGEKREAFLGVRRTGVQTIWCSTTASARVDEVEASMKVCRNVSWEG